MNETLTRDAVAADDLTMFGDIIKLLHGDRPTETDRLIHDAAITVRDEWPTLDAFERNVVETMLAWAVTRAGGMPRIHDHAHSRTQSPFSLRQHLTVGTDGTAAGMCRAIDERLASFRAARVAAQDGTAQKRCQELLAEMQAKHPRLGLSFGYIGNCDFGGRFDDRSWMFFTKLATPSCVGACDVSFGGQTTAYLGKLMQTAERDLATWCDDLEARLDAGKVRIVGSR